MRSHFLFVGDRGGDLHLEVREGTAEGPGPAACRHGTLAPGCLLQHIQVAGD
jgi:hypothetical protein